MLSKFTWSDYLIAAAILIALYYLVVAITFYRAEIRNLLSGKVRFKIKSKEARYREIDAKKDQSGRLSFVPFAYRY